MSNWVRNLPKGMFLDCEVCQERYWGSDAAVYLREFVRDDGEIDILCTHCIRGINQQRKKVEHTRGY